MSTLKGTRRVHHFECTVTQADECVSFKILWRNQSLKKRLEAGPLSCQVPVTRNGSHLSCCLETTYQTRSAGLRKPTDSRPKQVRNSQKARYRAPFPPQTRRSRDPNLLRNSETRARKIRDFFLAAA
jgi:hypothetical protein